MPTLKELFDDPDFAKLSQDDQAAAVHELVPNFDQQITEFRQKQQGLLREDKRQFWNAQDTGASPVRSMVESAAQGGLDALLAGIPEAIAKREGIDPNAPGSAKAENPYAFSGGQLGGLLLPVGGGNSTAAKSSRLVTGLAEVLPRSAAQWISGPIGRKVVGSALQGTGLGAAYGAMGGAANEISNPESGAGDIAAGAFKGAAIGAPIGAVTGGVSGRLSAPARDISEQAAIAEKKTIEALKAGLPPSGIASVEKNLSRTQPLIAKENPTPQSLDEFRDAISDANKRQWNTISKTLTTGTNKGLTLSGDELGLNVFKSSALLNQAYDRMNSVEQEAFDSAINALWKFRGKEYSGQGLENIAGLLLSKKGPYKDLPESARLALNNYVNSIDRDTGKLSGNSLFTEGLKMLYPADLSVPDSQILSAANRADMFRGRQLTPWEGEDRLQFLNKELGPLYKMQPATKQAAAETPYEIRAREGEAAAIRQGLNNLLSKVPDEFAENKRNLGALIELEQAANTAGTREKMTVFPSNADRAAAAHNTVAGVARYAGLKGNRDLTPSERIQIAFRAYQNSKKSAPLMIGRQGPGKLLEGITAGSPLTKKYAPAAVDALEPQ